MGNGYPYDPRGIIAYYEESERETDTDKMINLAIDRMNDFGWALFSTERVVVSITDRMHKNIQAKIEEKRKLLHERKQ